MTSSDWIEVVHTWSARRTSSTASTDIAISTSLVMMSIGRFSSRGLSTPRCARKTIGGG
jgi:hypothetical protein